MGILEIGETIGLGLVVAANPMPVVGQLTLLSRPDGPRVAMFLAGGWAGAVLVLVTAVSAGIAALFAALFGLEDEDVPAVEGYGASLVLGVVGAALLVLGAYVWARKPREADAPPSRFARTFDRLTPAKAVLVGAGLALLKPKTLAAVAAASTIIGAEGRLFVGSAILIVLFTVVGSLTVALPVMLHAFGGERVTGALADLQNWLSQNSKRITGGLMAVIGAVILVVAIVD
jgi:threonine/homoserine/homoserine lactone efflux protein